MLELVEVGNCIKLINCFFIKMLGVILIAKFHVKITSKQIQTLKAKIIWSVEIQFIDSF